ncbi:MAG: hypothetical protein EXS63_09415 [Candidatus Omnitrophica bacterium]|nr:hypothetical protein [Candidatus Omnitrophota bacterium]
MNHKSFSLFSALLVMTSLAASNPAYAVGVKEGAASLLLPTTGQSMNGELGSAKTKIMAGLEVGLVAATTILGITVGGPVVWVTAGPLVANHVWSSADAFISAGKNNQAVSSQNLQAAQQNLDLSREKRFEREQEYRSDIRNRVQSAGEQQG